MLRVADLWLQAHAAEGVFGGGSGVAQGDAGGLHGRAAAGGSQRRASAHSLRRDIHARRQQGAAALQQLHAIGIVHMDVKLENAYRAFDGR